ncbi:unnamed protein product [Chondrus crispus]|uniref:Uncharacterized protein n=1 Tax=Chondrus crispus TaxID=2769 RepID=S0F2Z1_CHOCR|nr:unnamed protein product [Chondrus crispus]CDF77510.1 unnamed protein product [Chondrus crispus]|eukprot:XP_005712549.1 unnamed protein product [Chondrus crispus]
MEGYCKVNCTFIYYSVYRTVMVSPHMRTKVIFIFSRQRINFCVFLQIEVHRHR